MIANCVLSLKQKNNLNHTFDHYMQVFAVLKAQQIFLSNEGVPNVQLRISSFIINQQ